MHPSSESTIVPLHTVPRKAVLPALNFRGCTIKVPATKHRYYNVTTHDCAASVFSPSARSFAVLDEGVKWLRGRRLEFSKQSDVQSNALYSNSLRVSACVASGVTRR